MGPELTRAYFWPAVNNRPTCLWLGYFLTQPKEVFFWPVGKKLKNLRFLGEIFQIQTQIINGWPDLGQKFLIRIGFSQFLLLWLVRVTHLWLKFGFAKFPLKIPNFPIFSLWSKKSLWVRSKSTWVRDRSASYLLRVKSMLGSEQGPISSEIIKLISGLTSNRNSTITLQEYSVQITFRQKWNDDRLSYDQRLSLGDMRCKWIYICFEIKNWLKGLP